MTKPINVLGYEMEDFTWTVEQYHQLIDAGIITPDHKVELLEGVIIKKMGINEPHAACVDGLHEYFYDRNGKMYTYRSENPIVLGDDSEPEPDFVICERRKDRYNTGHPTPRQVHLIIEVAESTVDKDRNYKSVLYATANLEEYWIINLRDSRVEVYLKPDQAAGIYRSITVYLKGDEFESPFSGLTKVDDLLPL